MLAGRVPVLSFARRKRGQVKMRVYQYRLDRQVGATGVDLLDTQACGVVDLAQNYCVPSMRASLVFSGNWLMDRRLLLVVSWLCRAKNEKNGLNGACAAGVRCESCSRGVKSWFGGK